jgi:hypothetical protein
VDDDGVVRLGDGGSIRTDPTCPDIEWPFGTYVLTGCCQDDGRCGLSVHTFPGVTDLGVRLACDPYAYYQQLGYGVPPGDPTCGQ